MRHLPPHLAAALILPLLPASALWAADGANAAGVPLAGGDTFSLAAAVFKALGALVLILGLMLLMARLFRRIGGGLGPMSQGAMINVLETRMLGPRKQLTVVEVGGEVLVLGVSEQQINLVSRLDDPGRLLRPVAPPARTAANGRIRRDSGFAALLDKALRPTPKKNKEEESHD
jgi:flagellar protein FliO/FliZ